VRVRFEAGTMPRVREHQHADFWEAVVVTSGCLRHRTPEKTWQMEAGDLIILPVGTTHSLTTTSSASSFINVAFCGDFWRGLAEHLLPPHPYSGVNRPTILCTGGFTTDLELALTDLVDDHQEHTRRLRALRCWSQLMEEVATDGTSSAPRPSWLARAIKDLRSEKGLREGLPGLFQRAGVSQEHLSRTVRQCFGMTPTELIIDHRLQFAARLLQGSDLQVTTIASKCGFGSVTYFDRCFKARFGMTPREMRRSPQVRLTPS
jgi:AraC-like DNA-binding protein